MNESEKNILIAVDESENAKRAVMYVADFLGGVPGFNIMVMHIIPEPDEDFFPNSEEKEKWIQDHQKKMENVLESYRQILIQAGFDDKDVNARIMMRYCPSMAECILTERSRDEYGTIVVGRQGLSRSEEFLFGSISSRIVNHAKNCTVWVVK